MLLKRGFGEVIIKNWNLIAFYSHNLIPTQIKFNTTERELLSIVNTLKYFYTIIIGHSITVYIYHKNITYENFTMERVLF